MQVKVLYIIRVQGLQYSSQNIAQLNLSDINVINGIVIHLSQWLAIIKPAVKVLAYTGRLDSTLPPLNPVWVTMKL